MSTTAREKPGLRIVDDDPLITDALHFVLTRDFEVYVAESRAQVKSLLTQLKTVPPLALVDLGLPPMQHKPDEGFALITDLLNHSKKIKIIVLSGQNDEANARHARAGRRRFHRLAGRAGGDQAGPAQRAAFRPVGRGPGRAGGAGGGRRHHRQQPRHGPAAPADPALCRCFFPVLIEGESSSGKELVANSLYRWSRRANEPYLALNWAAISPTLVEPTLFGYARGSFTGSNQAHSGYFEDARDGTLFLDEIGGLPLELQAKLRRVLENGEYPRVGETQSRFSNARSVAAPTATWAARCAKGASAATSITACRCSRYTAAASRATGGHARPAGALPPALQPRGGEQPIVISPEAQRMWEDYHFPGNVRELGNIVIRLTTKYVGHSVGPRELEAEFDLDLVSPEAIPLPTDAQVLHDSHKAPQKRYRFDPDG